MGRFFSCVQPVGSCGVVPKPPCTMWPAAGCAIAVSAGNSMCPVVRQRQPEGETEVSAARPLWDLFHTPYHSRPVALAESQYCLVQTSYSHLCGRTCRLTGSDRKKLPQHSRQLKANFFTVLHLLKTFSIFSAHFSFRAC